MGVGDELFAAAQAERLYRERGAPVLILDVQRRPRWHDIWAGNPAIIHPMDISDRSAVPTLVSAPYARPYIQYPFTPETGWTFNPTFRASEHVPSIYLTDEDRAPGIALREEIGPYILVDTWSKHPNLRWPIERWHQFVASNPTGLPIVQHFYGSAPRLVDVWLTGTHTFRAAAGMVASAAVYVRGESGIGNAAASLGVPCVTIWGGCLDWEIMGRLPKQVGVGITMPACGAYKRCQHCIDLMTAITPDEVWAGVQQALAAESAAQPVVS